jgi:hypothetical protein
VAAYYTEQSYDAPSAVIWSFLTDFPAWPEWFPQVSEVRFDDGRQPGDGTHLLALGETADVWTRWQIVEWGEPHLFVCEHVESNSPVSPYVDAAYLRFALTDDEEGCVLEVEIGAEGRGMIGDFFLGMTIGTQVRRLLPRIVDAFSDYVVRAAARQ